jgi:hypothetical protein
VRLLLGVIPMLVVAGVIEGFFSPSHLPASTKFIFAGVMAALLVSYLLSQPSEGKQDQPARATSAADR